MSSSNSSSSSPLRRNRPLGPSPLTSSTARLAALAFVVLLAPPTRAATITVGNDAQECDYTDLAQAIADADSGDRLELELTAFTGASGSNFNIVSKSLTLRGGYDGCSGQLSSGPTTINGGGADTVIEIWGSGSHSVELHNLVLIGGRDDTDDGGGLGIRGDFEVKLFGVSLVLNESDRGAGVFIDGSEGASLFMGIHSEISSNEAFLHGGGIYCTDGASVELNSVELRNNVAGAHGGAIHATSDCNVVLGVVSVPNQLLVEDNEAHGHGGAFFAAAGATIRGDGGYGGDFFVRGNTAGAGGQGFGGAGHAVGFSDLAQSLVSLRRAKVRENSATVGGAFYAEFYGEAGASSGGLPCDHFPCQEISENRAAHGGVGFAGENGEIFLKEAFVYWNQGTVDASVLWISDLGTGTVESSMVVSNGSAEPSVFHNRGKLEIEASTVTTNGATGHVFDSDGMLEGTGLILWANGAPLFSDASSVTRLDCVVVPSSADLPQHATLVSHEEPSFIDPPFLDYRLQQGSAGVDLCDLELPSLYPAEDIQGEPRVMGAATDAGADEVAQPLFADGFESGDTEAWI